LQAFIAQTGADELIVASQVFDHRARLRSYEIVAQAHAAFGKPISFRPRRNGTLTFSNSSLADWTAEEPDHRYRRLLRSRRKGHVAALPSPTMNSRRRIRDLPG
jgi:hypothetical protein